MFWSSNPQKKSKSKLLNIFRVIILFLVVKPLLLNKKIKHIFPNVEFRTKFLKKIWPGPDVGLLWLGSPHLFFLSIRHQPVTGPYKLLNFFNFRAIDGLKAIVTMKKKGSRKSNLNECKKKLKLKIKVWVSKRAGLPKYGNNTPKVVTKRIFFVTTD